jgi:hypothetical protein
MVNRKDSTLGVGEGVGEEDSGFHIGDISVARGTFDSMDDDDEEATNQEHLRIASHRNQTPNLEEITAGEEGSYFHIGEIVTRRTINSNGDGVASLATATAPSAPNNTILNLEEITAGEEGSCLHIGDIICTRTTINSNSNDDGVAFFTAATAPLAANNRGDNKKKWIMIGALVIATSLTIAIGGVILAGLGKKEEMGISEASSFLFDAESELPWWACLTKESCVDQAKLLGYADKDIRYGDFSYDEIYGCFKNEGVIYWGMGGTDAQNFSTEFSGQHKRLLCYDVNPNPFKGIDDTNCNSAIVQPSLSSSPSSSSSPITKTAGPSK